LAKNLSHLIFMKLMKYLLVVVCSISSIGSFASVHLNLTLQGTVNSSCTFSVNSVAATTSPAAASTTSVTLGLNAPSETPANAAVVITCNDVNGYSLTALSANSGSLKSGASTISYKLDVDTGTPTALTATATTLISKSSLSIPETAQSHPVRVTYTAGTPNVVSGTYSDTITFTLTGS
jgi:hypothetical protein